MKKTTRNILTGAGIAVAGICTAAATTYVLSKKLVEIAMDRKQPAIMQKNMEKITGSVEFNQFFKSLDSSTKKLENSALERVEITSFAGTKLVGHCHNCENPKRIIVAVHGWRSTWARDFGTASASWFKNDCCVLFVEQRAQGNSEGDYIGFGLLERYDCLEWIKWVNGRTESKLPIYLCGVSMGATTVLMASALDLPENVKGIVSDCAFTSPLAIWKHIAKKNLHVPYGKIFCSVTSALCKQKINYRPDDYSTLEAMKVCKLPVLFVNGTEDSFVPVEMPYENYKACNAPKRLLIVPGADHGMSYCKEKEKYETATKEFWAYFD